jgi:hypothetical protein
MYVKAMMFVGSCEGCRVNKTKSRAAVDVDLRSKQSDPNACGELLCTSCARKLGDRLIRAANAADHNVKDGLEYRNDRWQKKA